MPILQRQEITGTEIDKRIGNLQQVLCEEKIDAALIVQKTDLFYFSGTAQQGYLYIPDAGEPLLMVFKDFERARQESPLRHIASLSSPRKIPELVAQYGYQPAGTIGLELDVLPVNLYRQYRKIFDTAETADISHHIRLLRAVKSEFEIDCIRQAARGSDLVCAKVSELLEIGRTELELAGELEGYARSLGHQGIVRMRLWGSELFYGHLLSGAGAALPSYLASPTGGAGPSRSTAQGAGFNRIRKNEPILVDYVFAFDGYLSDHTRIFCIGALPDELLRGHDAMLEIQEQVKGCALPGAASGEIYKIMVDLAEKKGVGAWFMGVGERRIRFTGHGIGLELDEYPFLASGQKMHLEKNMIIALEPKLIIPGQGVVGIENTHLVTDQGLEPITTSPDQITFL